MYPANTLTIDAHIKPLDKYHIDIILFRKSEISMVDPARHTGLPERTLGDVFGPEISNPDADF